MGSCDLGRLANKRVLVTAAGQGIGRAVAYACRREGAHVFAADLNENSLRPMQEDGFSTKLLDGTDSQAVFDYVKDIGRIDAAIHCIGYVHQGTVLECPPDEWYRSFSINVDSYYHLLCAILPEMLTATRGSIVCISSVVSSIKGFPNRAAYGATKAAMIGLTKATAADYAKNGIRCNALCPGTITSPSLLARVSEVGEKAGGYDKALEAFVARQPMQRLGSPEEIAQLAIYLASDESSFITGQAICIDGGITI